MTGAHAAEPERLREDSAPARDAFLAVLSHELRTPITTIYAGSSMLAREADLSSPATRTLAHDISAEAARLYDLVEDLLVLARVEHGALEPIAEPVLVQRELDATIHAAADQDAGGTIVRTGDADPPPVLGDATYVKQACRNLIAPSSRSGARVAGQPLVVDLQADELRHEVKLRVLDRGPGLDDAALERVFALPSGTTSGRTAVGGLGPFVCRQLIDAMGGRTWAANRPDGGVEIGFALPMLDATA